MSIRFVLFQLKNGNHLRFKIITMQLVFKIITDTDIDVATIGDTNFQQHYSGVNTSMAWAELQPAIRQATAKYVIPYLGEEIYDDLADKFNTGAVLTTEQAKALQILQDTVAFYAIYHVLPEKNAVVASNGVVQNTPDGGAQPVNQWGWKAKRWSALENADSFLDLLLTFLEKQVSASVAYFDLWKNSDAYTVKTSAFFRQTSQLDEYLNIQMSRRSFISLTRFMKQVEEDVIKPTLCTDLYDAMLIETPTAPNQLLLPYIRRAVAYLGAAEAVPHHRIVIDGDGFRVVSQSDQFDDRRNLTNNVHESAVQALMIRCEDQGRKAVARMIKFMEEHIGDYPAYANSTCRDLPQRNAHTIIQSPDGIGAVMFS